MRCASVDRVVLAPAVGQATIREVCIMVVHVCGARVHFVSQKQTDVDRCVIAAKGFLVRAKLHHARVADTLPRANVNASATASTT